MRKNTLFLMIYEIMAYLAPLITAPYIARVLGADGTGTYSFTNSIASYYILFIQLGVSLYGRREIASQNTMKKQSKLFWEIFSSTSFMFLITTIAYVFGIALMNGYRKEMAFQFPLLIAAWLDISWFFFGIEKFKIAVLRNIIVKILSLFLVFLLVKTPQDTNTYILILSLSNFVGAITMWLTLRRYVEKPSINFASAKKHYKNLFVLFIPILAVQLYSITDKFCLGLMDTISEVGIYENAYKISRVPVVIITAIGTVMLPRITNMISRGENKKALKYIDKSLSLTLIMGIGCAFGLISIAEPFIKIYLGDNFIGSIPILQILSIALIILAWGNVFRMQYILPNKLDNIYVKSVIIGAIINIVLNLTLIPILHGIGAAIASIISEFIVCIYQSYKIRGSFNYWHILKQNSKYLFCGFMMLISVIQLGDILPFSNIARLLLQILIGIIVYLIGIIIVELSSKNKVATIEMSRILNKAKRRK